MKCPVPPRLLGVRAGRFLPPGLFAGLLVFIIVMPSVARYAALIPPCGMRTLTGLPCPLCGGTRALLALSHGHPIEALLLNPLFFLVCVGICGWFVLWLFDDLFKRNSQAFVTRWALGCPCVFILSSGALLNWIYLCLRLPH
jgi:hypothetical protein